MEFSHLLPHRLEPGPGKPSQFLQRCNQNARLTVPPRVRMRARGDWHTTEADLKRCPADLIKKKNLNN